VATLFTRHINKFLCKATQKRCGGLAITPVCGTSVTVIETLILCNYNSKILPNCILNYTRAYNLFWVQRLWSHCGHLVSVTYTNKHKHCCCLPFSLSLSCLMFAMSCAMSSFVFSLQGCQIGLFWTKFQKFEIRNKFQKFGSK